jgi:serine protease Do
MKLATEILRFFYRDIDNDQNASLKTLDEFARSRPGWYETLNMQEILRICNKLEQEGYLIEEVGGFGSVLNNAYLCPNFDEKRAEYGEYEFIVNGFLSIRNHFSEAVRPVIVTKPDDSLDIGTCFLAGNHHTLVTARHVIENMKLVQIEGIDGQPINVAKIVVPEKQNHDVAILLVSDNALKDLPPFRFQDGYLLEEVLCIGYPPIPGFEAIQLAETATINTIIKSARGEIIGTGQAYLDGQEYILINARVKGGNSGSPVINRKGYVVGILVQTSLDPNDASKLDELGYGIATPRKQFINLLRGDSNPNPPVIELAFENIPGCGFKTFPADSWSQRAG